jgi:F-type H+-transporting ATPase subunit delta
MALALQAASRGSLADLLARLDAYVDQVGPDDLERLGDQLFSVARLLAGERGLRRHLADPGVPGSARAGVVERLLGGQLDQPALEAAAAAAALRWSQPSDLVEGLEAMSRSAVLASAEKAGALDEVEDELFRFGRIVDREPQLARLLGDDGEPVDGRIALLDGLLAGKVSRATATLLHQAVRLPRGRHLDTVAEDLAALAAARRERSVARVTTPVRLTPEQEDRLRDSLGRLYGRSMSLQVELDEALLGGLVVQVGGEVVDGSVAGRLDAARRRLPR